MNMDDGPDLEDVWESSDITKVLNSGTGFSPRDISSRRIIWGLALHQLMGTLHFQRMLECSTNDARNLIAQDVNDEVIPDKRLFPNVNVLSRALPGDEKYDRHIFFRKPDCIEQNIFNFGPLHMMRMRSCVRSYKEKYKTEWDTGTKTDYLRRYHCWNFR